MQLINTELGQALEKIFVEKKKQVSALTALDPGYQYDT